MLKRFLKVMQEIKNWPLFILDYLKLIKKREIIYVHRSGVKFLTRTNSLDRAIINEIFCYDCYGIKNHKIKIQEKDIIVDIGAQAGFFSMYCAKKASKGEIFCYEPIKENFLQIKKNKELNKLTNIFPHNLAVSEKRGKIKIWINPINCGGHSVYSKDKIFFEEVKCITLNDVIKENKLEKIDLLKIDCEGSEYGIFNNLKEENLKRIKQIAMEAHYLDENKNPLIMINYLRKNNFNVFSTKLKKNSSANILAIRNNEN